MVVRGMGEGENITQTVEDQDNHPDMQLEKTILGLGIFLLGVKIKTDSLFR